MVELLGEPQTTQDGAISGVTVDTRISANVALDHVESRVTLCDGPIEPLKREIRFASERVNFGYIREMADDGRRIPGSPVQTFKAAAAAITPAAPPWRAAV